MPQPVSELKEPCPILGRHERAVLVEVGEICDAWAKATILPPLDMTWRRIALELAEVARESDLLLVGDVQAAKDQYSVLIHPRFNCCDILDAERVPRVDPNNLPVPETPGVYRSRDDRTKTWKDIWGAGQGVGNIDDVPTVAALVDRLEAEYHAARRRIGLKNGAT